jgi:hypothetical protein
MHHWEILYSNNVVYSYVSYSWLQANTAVMRRRATKLVFHCISNPLYVQYWNTLERQHVT